MASDYTLDPHCPQVESFLRSVAHELGSDYQEGPLREKFESFERTHRPICPRCTCFLLDGDGFRKLAEVVERIKRCGY